MSEDQIRDLPLMSNVNDILVEHYMFDFVCDFQHNYFICCAVLLLKPVVKDKISEFTECTCFETKHKHRVENKSLHISYIRNEKRACKKKGKTFYFILDCHQIIVSDVSEVDLSFEMLAQYSGLNVYTLKTSRSLNFVTNEWSLKIWKENCCKFCFPKVLRISYRTIPNGPSLMWVKDQDENPAVLTYGSWVNNRSLFPCQEPPTAMATWEATVSVRNSAVVLMSGDEEPQISHQAGITSYYYYTKKVLPLSTLCLAVGLWNEHTILARHSSGPKCRIFAPVSLLDQSVLVLFEYAPYCLKIAEDIFGHYPFPRIDFLIVPPTFGSLGMASPNVAFLSQSLLTKDLSMNSRIAHEIAHGWFGLLIGALDWTEEWLSEGFATFVEDYFHAWIMNMTDKERKDYLEVKAYIRMKVLLQEINNTDDELQVLRPSEGAIYSQSVDGVEAVILKNGQNPEKAFVQVHYIKGYFLLKHLSDIVGASAFFQFLSGYINKFKGQLVTSKDFLVFFHHWFPDVSDLMTVEKIYEDWLHNPGLSNVVKEMKPSSRNLSFSRVLNEAHKWKQINLFFMKKRMKVKLHDMYSLSQFNSDEVLLLLENLLDEPNLSHETLKYMDNYFNFKEASAEVQHRWFEIVVKHKYEQGYSRLKAFLTDHLAMGVYLYGELLFSGDPTLAEIAEKCFAELKDEMEPNYVTVIGQMLKTSRSLY